MKLIVFYLGVCCFLTAFANPIHRNLSSQSQEETNDIQSNLSSQSQEEPEDIKSDLLLRSHEEPNEIQVSEEYIIRPLHGGNIGGPHVSHGKHPPIHGGPPPHVSNGKHPPTGNTGGPDKDRYKDICKIIFGIGKCPYKIE